MAAPTNGAKLNMPLANGEPSTQGRQQKMAIIRQLKSFEESVPGHEKH
jgi:hypothetical protein